ncbi:APH(3'') family aminoglycoside O-phosphotransferase [Kibdelosporangium phytohabitans]|uniref:APH(3'') family aminoglycoside O-phosphotransferase n=1 Tax=Kibdelosporangium phytohabitans TaxID=860235 RepID=UPI0019E1A7B9|nr:APH(3'') family aminoglycoside O-phosphotransferase [Kibdelosporangium phytohabitans]MBE1469386.1 streptomycin 3'-kinase [Kibdelosporangium phytohabitans]
MSSREWESLLVRHQHQSGGWEPVTNGESGAFVFRSADGSRYAKCVPAADEDVLTQERDRVAWLATTGVPGPSVLDWITGTAGACLVTSAVHGVSAERVSAEELRQAWPSITEATRRLHALPARDCPFSRDLEKMFTLAQDVVERGAVNPDFLPEDQVDTPPGELLGRLAAQLDLRVEQEAGDTVVCHGDLCLPNIVLDPATLTFAGFIDLGRLGKADRYADICLLLANSRETWDGEDASVAADEAFARDYGITLDHARQEFYLHLDPLTWG